MRLDHQTGPPQTDQCTLIPRGRRIRYPASPRDGHDRARQQRLFYHRKSTRNRYQSEDSRLRILSANCAASALAGNTSALGDARSGAVG